MLMLQGVCAPLGARPFPVMLLIICRLQQFTELSYSRYAKEVCDAIVAKCLTGRPKTVEKAQAAFLLWVELEAAEVFLVSCSSPHLIVIVVRATFEMYVQ